jgi:ferredoxin-NADP reductase
MTLSAEIPDSYTVGVKRDENSRGGSRYIIEQMKAGDQPRWRSEPSGSNGPRPSL